MEHGNLNSVTGSEVGHYELPRCLNSLALLAVDMVKQCLTGVHRRTRNFGRPVELGVFPLLQFLFLFVLRVVALVWQMVLIEAEFVEYRAFLSGHPVHLLLLGRLQVFFEPSAEVVLA